MDAESGAPLLPSVAGSVQGSDVEEKGARRYCFGRLSGRALAASGALAVVLLATLAVVGVYVIAPDMAQSELDNAQISFVQVNLTDPHADWLTSVTTAQISHVSPMSGTLGAMTASVEFAGVKFGELDLPEVALSAGETTTFSSSSPFRITDMDTWFVVAEAILMSDAVDWTLRGKATVTGSVLGVSITQHVDMAKVVTLPGAGGLADVKLLVFDMADSTPDTVVVEMTVEVNNPSVVNIVPAGDLQFDIEYHGTYMGTLRAQGANLYAGDSTLSMTGVLESENITAVNDLVSRYLSDVPTTVTAVGTSVNASSIALYNTPLEGLALDTVLMGTPTPLLAGLDVAAMTIAPQPDDDSEVGISMAAVVAYVNPLGDDSPIAVQTVAIEADVLGGDGSVLGHLSTPAAPAAGQTATDIFLDEDAMLTFADEGAAFGRFVADFINADEVELQLSGSAVTDAECAVGNVSLTVPLDLAASLAGMSGLDNVTLQSFDVPADAPGGGETISVDAVLFNPTVGSLTVPTLEADMATADGVVLGSLSGSDVTLAPGFNALTLSGAVNPAADALDAAGAFFTAYLQGEDQDVRMLGTGGGADAPAWLQTAIQAMAITTTFPGYADPLGLLTDMVINAMEMDLTLDPPLISGDVNASVVFPAEFGFAAGADSTLRLLAAPALSFDLSDADGAVCASVALADVPLQFDPASGALQFAFEAVELSVVDADGLAAILSDVLNTASAAVVFSGSSTITMQTNMGVLDVGPLAFDQALDIPGINAFADPAPIVSGIDIAGDDGAGSLLLTGSLTLANPSPLGGNFGPVTLDLLSQGVKVAEATVAEFVVAADSTFTLAASVVYTTPADAVAVGTAFMGNFIWRTSQAVSAAGSASSTAIALLQPAVAAFEAAATLPGMDQDLLTGAGMSLALFSLDLPTTLTTTNPFSSDIAIVGADVDITFCTSVGSSGDCDKWGDKLGYYTKDDLSSDPMTIPAQTSDHVTAKHKATIAIAWDDFQALWDSLFSGALCKTSGTITVAVGSFTTDVSPFDQEHVTVTL